MKYPLWFQRKTIASASNVFVSSEGPGSFARTDVSYFGGQFRNDVHDWIMTNTIKQTKPNDPGNLSWGWVDNHHTIDILKFIYFWTDISHFEMFVHEQIQKVHTSIQYGGEDNK